MSEQPGNAAGTAKPQSTVEYNKPWSISTYDPAVIVDANGGTVALAIRSPFFESPKGADSVLTAAHIVAAVNFCEFLTTEELDWFMQDRKRRAAALRNTFEANSDQFPANQAIQISRLSGGLI